MGGMYWITIIIYVGIIYVEAKCDTNEKEARAYLDYLDKIFTERNYKKTLARFNYETNCTEENLEKWNEETALPDIDSSEYKYFDWKSFNNSKLLRAAEYYGLLDTKIDPKVDEEFNNIIEKMSDIAGDTNTTVCDYKNRSRCGYDVFLEMWSVFDKSLDFEEIDYYFNQFMDANCQAVRPYFEEYINISNVYAKQFGYANRADMLIDVFEDPPINEFECAMRKLWKDFKPFYEQYFSYTRSRCRKLFGKRFISQTGPLPASMFILHRKELVPYPEASKVEFRELFKKKNYTVMDNVKMSEDFYTSLGLERLPKPFWEKSVFGQPKDRKSLCVDRTYHLNKEDERILICGNHPDIVVHEMGHAHYHHGLRAQPYCFRGSPNNGLDEGIADTMTLAIASNKFLSRIGVLNASHQADEKEEINTLYSRLTLLINQLPDLLATELWRWNLFRNNIPIEECNKVYWDYSREFQGIYCTENHTEKYLDAAQLTNLLYDDPLISYFIQPLLEYQIFEALCIAAREYDPNNTTGKALSDCDIYGSKEAGKVFTKLYTPGNSQSWAVTMQDALGKPFVDGGSFMRYFQKLYDWFVQENQRNGEYIGWK